MMSFHLTRSYRRAIDSDNKSHLPMGGGNSIISKLPEDCVKEVSIILQKSY